MEVTIIGSGTCVPSRHRASPCVHVAVGGMQLLLDTGPGALRQLLLAGISIDEIDMIVYTHFHIDHTADFCPFLFASKYGRELERSRGLTVMGPPGLAGWYESLSGVYGTWIKPEKFSLHWIETADAAHGLSGFSITSAAVLHSGSSIAVRIEQDDGKALAYSGDTDYCQGIVSICSNAAKAILECSCPEEHMLEGHLSPSKAGRIARESRCKSLLLTHLYPEADRHDLLTPLRREYGGPAEVARDLMKFSL